MARRQGRERLLLAPRCTAQDQLISTVTAQAPKVRCGTAQEASPGPASRAPSSLLPAHAHGHRLANLAVARLILLCSFHPPTLQQYIHSTPYAVVLPALSVPRNKERQSHVCLRSSAAFTGWAPVAKIRGGLGPWTLALDGSCWSRRAPRDANMHCMYIVVRSTAASISATSRHKQGVRICTLTCSSVWCAPCASMLLHVHIRPPSRRQHWRRTLGKHMQLYYFHAFNSLHVDTALTKFRRLCNMPENKLSVVLCICNFTASSVSSCMGARCSGIIDVDTQNRNGKNKSQNARVSHHRHVAPSRPATVVSYMG